MKIHNPIHAKVNITELKKAVQEVLGAFRKKTLFIAKKSGYVMISHNQTGVYAHQVLYKYWHPDEDLKGRHVTFKDGNRKNLTRSNLVSMSWSEHSAATGHKAKGKMRKKLDEDAVLNALQLNGNKRCLAAKVLNVTPSTLTRFLAMKHIQVRPKIINKVGCIFDEHALLEAIKYVTKAPLKLKYTIIGRGHSFKYPDIGLNGKHYLVHRVLMSYWLHRPLKPKEVVHHKDGNKLNSIKSNLECLAGAQEHRHKHSRDFRLVTCVDCGVSIKARGPKKRCASCQKIRSESYYIRKKVS